ncbi:MAG: hypothetical protein M3525_06480 [Acidobacteriota bacterium]|nr:hypothetical protein [Acidobacteriota bacterium]
MTETERNNNQGLIKPEPFNQENTTGNEYMSDFKTQAQDYGQKFQDAAGKAKVFATEKFSQVSGKLKELEGKDPQQLVQEAKEYARQKPGQAILVSAAVGLVLGLIFRGRR